MHFGQPFEFAAGGTRTSWVCSPHSLSSSDIGRFAAGLALLEGAWSVERFKDCDGQMSLLLTPESVDDGTLSFSVDRTTTGLRVTAWRGDTHGVMGIFSRTQDALGLIWKLVEAEHSKSPIFDQPAFQRACHIIAQEGAATAH